MAEFSLENVALDGPLLEQARAGLLVRGRQARTVRTAGRFLKGPIPMAWIAAADKAGALMVGMCLWYLAGLNKSDTFKASNAALAPWGINRERKARGLRKLADASLIALTGRPNASPIVTMLDRPLETSAPHPSARASGPAAGSLRNST
jgi:hypothetical protein